MSARSPIVAFLLSLALCLVAATAADAATPAPAWDIQSIAAPTNFLPGEESGRDSYQIIITNTGGRPTDGTPITIVDTLPRGIGVKGLELRSPRGSSPFINSGCKAPVTTAEVTTVSCEVTDALLPGDEPARLEPGNALLLQIKTTVPADAAGMLVNQVRVEGGGAATITAQAENQVSAEDAKAGFEEFKAAADRPRRPAGEWRRLPPLPVHDLLRGEHRHRSAGAADPVVAADGNLREIEVKLPPGLAGNPTAIERCTGQQFNTNLGGVGLANLCPDGSAVGLVTVEQLEGMPTLPGDTVPLYNLVPPKGMPAQFGFRVLGAPFYIDTKLRSDSDYGITAYLENVTEAQRATATQVTIWGTPWDKSHDTRRGLCGTFHEGSCPAPGTPRPFLRLPSSCASPLLSLMSFETWARPSAGAATSFAEPAPTACSQRPLRPDDRSHALDQRRRRPLRPSRRRPPAAEGKRRPRRTGRGRSARRDGHPARGPLGQPLLRRRSRRLLPAADRLPGRQGRQTELLHRTGRLPRRLEDRHGRDRHPPGRPPAARLDLPRQAGTKTPSVPSSPSTSPSTTRTPAS